MGPLEAATVHLEAAMVLLAVATAHQEATTQCQHQHHQTIMFHLVLAMARQEAAMAHQAIATVLLVAAMAHQAIAMVLLAVATAHQEATTQCQHQPLQTIMFHLVLATPSTPAAIDYRTTRAAN